MKRTLHNIPPLSTSYEMGLKRVLLSSKESGCSISQVAVIAEFSSLLLPYLLDHSYHTLSYLLCLKTSKKLEIYEWE